MARRQSLIKYLPIIGYISIIKNQIEKFKGKK